LASEWTLATISNGINMNRTERRKVGIIGRTV
jgi:hypothetical protein